MKFVKTLLIIGLLLAFVGCTREEKITQSQDLVTFSEDGEEVTQASGNCILTATEEESEKFFMVTEIFEKNIPCETKLDCYEFLLENDDYRRLAPEFEEYLDCEERDDTISPNPITKDGKMHP